MNKRKGLYTITSILLVFLLFTPVVVRLAYAYVDDSSKQISVTKTSSTPAKSDLLLYEEKEKEEKGTDNSLTQPALIYVIAEFSFVTLDDSHRYSYNHTTCFGGSTPLYLAKRYILV